jgi:hypothetical protein
LLLREDLTAQRNLVVRALESQQHAQVGSVQKIVIAQLGDKPPRSTNIPATIVAFNIVACIRGTVAVKR